MTFTDWVSEETKFDDKTREMALAHKIKNETEGAYRRGVLFKKRQQVMEAWARYVSGGEVVSFPARQTA